MKEKKTFKHILITKQDNKFIKTTFYWKLNNICRVHQTEIKFNSTSLWRAPTVINQKLKILKNFLINFFCFMLDLLRVDSNSQFMKFLKDFNLIV